MELIKKVNYNLVILVAYVVKCLVTPVSFADSVVLLALVSPVLLKMYLKIKEPKPLDPSIYKELDQLKKDVQYLKSEMSAANVASVIKAPTKKYFG
jgi:hypothetical protein